VPHALSASGTYGPFTMRAMSRNAADGDAARGLSRLWGSLKTAVQNNWFDLNGARIAQCRALTE
jgi:hypothetical protein